MWLERCDQRGVVREAWLERCGQRGVITEVWSERLGAVSPLTHRILPSLASGYNPFLCHASRVDQRLLQKA